MLMGCSVGAQLFKRVVSVKQVAEPLPNQNMTLLCRQQCGLASPAGNHTHLVFALVGHISLPAAQTLLDKFEKLCIDCHMPAGGHRWQIIPV